METGRTDRTPEAGRSPTHGERRAIVDQARQAWVRKLIDISRRNNLLFFRELKTGTLDLSNAPPEAIERLLSGESVDVHELVPEEEEKEQVQRAGKVQEIRRRALANYEERGLLTLFVSLGMASWTPADEGRPAAAPVFLLPVQVESRGREGRKAALRRAGDLQLNEVLLHVLDVEHGVTIPGDALINLVNDVEESLDLGRAYEYLKRFAGRIPGFTISNKAFLGNFSFQKLAMVKDLQQAGDGLAVHDVVAAIAGHLGARQSLGSTGSSLEPRQLDQIPPEQEFLVLDADSSQQAVIAAVISGKSGVIQGPPGTGKSQTIANLIAELVAQGKKVLFVAEKRAALDVVLRRLEEVGLGHLALDLHGAEVDRRKVMGRLSDTLSHVRESAQVEVAALHGRFVHTRARLNEHVSRLHSRRVPSGLSVYEMQGCLLRLSDHEVATRWRGADLGRLDAAATSAIRDLLTEAAGFEGLFLRNDPSPWTGANLPDGAAVQRAMDLAARLARETEPALSAVLSAIVRNTGLRPPKNLLEASALARVLQDVDTTLQVYRGQLFQQNLDALAQELAPARGRFTAFWAWCSKPAYRKAVAAMRTHRRNPSAPARLLLTEVLAARDQRKRWRALSRPDALPTVSPDLKRFRTALDTLLSAVKSLGSYLRRGDLAELALDDFRHFIKDLAADTTTPHRLPRLIAIERELEVRGVQALLSEIREKKPGSSSWPALFDRAWIASCLERAWAEDPALPGFNGRTHAALVEEFKNLDRQRLMLAVARVKRAHAERVIAAMNSRPDQEDLVRREAAKKTRHLPLRRLVALAPDVLTALQPCWMASPLSVSQLLPPECLFDVVLFDEASQVLPEDAVPAVMRGRCTVVAGDRHQLPPTTFFAAGEEEDEEAESAGASEGFESILDLMRAFLNPWSLDWHYRSRDESLIAFSNRHIYGDRLVTFPGTGGEPVLSHVLVQQTAGAEGQEESVSAEVSKVVELVLQHAIERPRETLGVIAMGIIHARRVQAALDQALRERPELDSFFDQTKLERFFIKNLERVQGDERDAIILTVGYGKDRSGRLPYRFGPLLIQGGERRLNVAVTRARRRLTLVSSFSHIDMDPGRSKARGVELLRLYIEYAASGGRRLGDGGGPTIPLNAFEQDVHDALVASGVSLLPQWGASRYRIDLVAQHPKNPGRFILAIECDGASYHASPTARDRDRLRQQHLEALGWRFHRIWSTDWFMRRAEEIQRALTAFREAAACADTAGVKGGRAESAPPPMPPMAPNNPKRGPRPYVPRREKIDDYSQAEIQAIIRWVQSDGRLRTDDELVRAVMDEMGFERRGSRIDAVIRAAIAAARSMRTAQS